ncbi:hypothetical protein OG974_20890 [Streptomyces sp. NBC_00597]|uniref:hypothetical protein n=1 Tax=Streptomyces sp. NBC_00597 TaxID=2975786 RepID=UPI0030E22937
MGIFRGKASNKAVEASKVEAARDELIKERAQVAYKAAMDLFAAQDRTASNLRTRVSGIFATSAFVVTFSSSVRLVGNDPSKGLPFPFWAAVTLFAVIAVQGILVMLVLWPTRWSFGHSVYAMVNPSLDDADRAPVNRQLVESLVDGLNRNKVKITRMGWLYRGAIFLLLVEVSVILAAIISAS